MSYSEEEIQKYLNIQQSYKDTSNNTSLIFQDTIPLKKPEKVFCHNCDNTHLLKLRFTAMVTYSFHLYSRSSQHFIQCFIPFTG